MRNVLLTLMLCFSVSGCVAPIILAVGAGAVGGYAISRDTFEGITSKGQDEIWDASMRVMSIMGYIDYSDKKRGEITGRVNGAVVNVYILPVSLSTTKLRIKARNGIFPRVATAQDVYTKIISQLDQ